MFIIISYLLGVYKDQVALDTYCWQGMQVLVMQVGDTHHMDLMAVPPI